MHKSSRLPFRLWAFLALSLTLATTVLGQGITTAAMNGLVTDKQGRPVAGAQVTIVHEPSGTRATTVTRSTGQYTMSGLRVGGPYTVSIGALGGLQATSRTDI